MLKKNHQLLVLLIISLSSFLLALWLFDCNPRAPRLPKLPKSSLEQCSPKSSSLVFAKTHKCASTTLQNILLRNALKNDLDVALPLMGNYLGRNRAFEKSHLAGTKWFAANISYDLFALHAIFDFDNIVSIMREEPIVFTIVRDPVELFISLWDYAQMERVHKVDLEQFAMSKNKKKRVGNLGRNQMLFDLGLKEEFFDNFQAVSHKIEVLEAQFDLVMVAERFDESMVLLRNQLCWPMDKMAYLKLNAREKSTKTKISNRARAALKEWLWADYMLYDHFADEFDRKISDFGAQRMKNELKSLNDINKNIEIKCISDVEDSHKLKGDFRLWGKHTLGYRLREDAEESCQLFAVSEISLVDRLREKQAKRMDERVQT